MICGWHRWRWSLRRDDGRPPTPGTARHFASCPDCRAYARQIAELEEALAAARAPAAPERLTAVAIAAAKQLVEGRRQPAMPRWAPAVAWVAVVLAGAALATARIQRQRDLARQAAVVALDWMGATTRMAGRAAELSESPAFGLDRLVAARWADWMAPVRDAAGVVAERWSSDL